jgi:DNA-binding transcriptional ArsR family regulator
MEPDPLQDLLLDADEVDRGALARALAGIVGVDKKSGRVVLQPGFSSLDTRRRALAYVLGAKVSTLLGLREDETVTPKELQQATGMPPGTVRPKLSQLKEQRLVSKTGEGAYFIAGHQIPAVIEDLSKA